MLAKLDHSIIKLRQMKPLVLCLTNHVTMDFMANCLLSCGAAPIMTQDVAELDELVQISHVVTINIGTLDAAFIERATMALQLAKTYNKSVVFDPVGAGASSIRTASSRTLMKGAAIIRGNASEIMALVENTHKSLGVESIHTVSDAADSARILARNYHCSVVVSGARDFITDGIEDAYLAYGSPLMPLVTGMGCALTAIIAAFKAVIPNPYEAAHLASAYFSLCGSLAGQKTDAPGSFRTLFIDELYKADFIAMGGVNHAP